MLNIELLLSYCHNYTNMAIIISLNAHFGSLDPLLETFVLNNEQRLRNKTCLNFMEVKLKLKNVLVN
jgi:hypothetical protein